MKILNKGQFNLYFIYLFLVSSFPFLRSKSGVDIKNWLSTCKLEDSLDRVLNKECILLIKRFIMLLLNINKIQVDLCEMQWKEWCSELTKFFIERPTCIWNLTSRMFQFLVTFLVHENFQDLFFSQLYVRLLIREESFYNDITVECVKLMGYRTTTS